LTIITEQRIVGTVNFRPVNLKVQVFTEKHQKEELLATTRE